MYKFGLAYLQELSEARLRLSDRHLAKKAEANPDDDLVMTPQGPTVRAVVSRVLPACRSAPFVCMASGAHSVTI